MKQDHKRHKEEHKKHKDIIDGISLNTSGDSP